MRAHYENTGVGKKEGEFGFSVGVPVIWDGNNWDEHIRLSLLYI
jgi:hypothetical protein